MVKDRPARGAIQSMVTVEGKKLFYPKVEKAFLSKGYEFYSEDKIHGKGRSHLSKPDYVAVKNDIIIIGETKSPNEGPTTSSWRQTQKNDTNNFKIVRADVSKREKTGAVSKKVGGHEIIIRGQIPDYVNKIGRTFYLPDGLKDDADIKGGYSFPSSETENVEKALKNCGISKYEKIDTNNGTTSIIYILRGSL